MPEAVLKKAMALLPDVPLTQGDGQTEAAPVIIFLEPRFHVKAGITSSAASTEHRFDPESIVHLISLFV